ncbi:ParB-like nuclease domain-containing protein [Streptomyces sp. 2323.1]|uniref:ParB/RepB/Spo0J family partition protein n=1 Tax=Streptomyces sp. 2323.1 TaxID=1938841 RepID=UPI000BB7BF34|nr:ParB/RepB/Spo0J family partition protein [Streptomyces sp. 2323.1]SOE10446.1 ParB-like nuclease domain-containing protein [Streptomyces sp. 2323.1]
MKDPEGCRSLTTEISQPNDTCPFSPPPGQEIIDIPIQSILPADSPRSAGSDSAHAWLLAKSDAELPPIILQWPSMRVIDGMHRLEAARIRGESTVRARFFEGDAEEAFILAVETNTKHGLPLTLADRKAAALRIVKAHPHLSDRAVAAKVGLAHKTVGAIRRSSGDVPQLTARVGRDGRVRSVAPSGRGKRSTAVPATQNRSAATGDLVSVSAPGAVPAKRFAGIDTDWKANLQRLRTDPSLRYSEAGRLVLRALDAHVAAADQLHHIAELLPEHCLSRIAEFALKCAEDYHRLSALLEQRRAEGC